MARVPLPLVLAAAEETPIDSGSLAGHGYKLRDLRQPHLHDEVAKLLRSRPKTAAGLQAKAFAQFVLAEESLRLVFPDVAGPLPRQPSGH